ncbi:MAG: carboxylesterase family protein [Firmicutes bacterium]|nr:carboxylesterase family protein [Bacillota bacterium]
MKKLFTIDDFVVAFISALGYGFGETILQLTGLSELACAIISLVVGIVIEEIISKIAFSETVQRKPLNRVITYIGFFLVFVIGHYTSVKYLGESMIPNLMEEFAFVVGLPVIGFFINLGIRAYRIIKIHEVYDDGSEGYVFDVNKEEIEDINIQNKSDIGEYDADDAVKTRTGIFVGEKSGETISYYGIPYAKPPVGKLRWKAPEPLPSSQKVFEAKNYGDSAIQVEHKGAILKLHRQSEDCLSLNVFVNNDKNNSKKPVVVLFHHGDFTYGGSADPLTYGENFAGEHSDVVFVSFNYRLGIFGFIDFSDVPGGEDYPDALNLGLLDQIAALQWIKENIAAFGGDPEQITVLGFDSGAVSISMLAACEKAKGLFKKAFVFNGSPEVAYDTPEASRALAKELLKETHTSTMEELAQLETETLKDAAQKLWKNICAPTYDKKLFPEDLYHAYKEGAAAGIEFVIGIPSNESMVLRSFIGNYNYERLVAVSMNDIQKDIDTSTAAAIREYIEKKSGSSSEIEAKSKLIDQWVAVCIYQSAEKLSEGGNKVHLMYWDEKPLLESLGSGSVDAVAALLGNREALQLYGNVMNDDLSEILQNFLIKFIKGEALQLYNNEIVGVDAFDWKPFPEALIVADGNILCDKIENRLTEIKNN